jgi:phosphoribosylformimino-5-aminoimidazole carboxamide ribotide isomerase
MRRRGPGPSGLWSRRLKPLLLVPAIDLRDGKVVRLLRGSFSDATRYPQDPVETARRFQGEGARWIHIVDLDAAEGKGRDNGSLIARIRQAVACRMQVGGGVRTADHAGRLLALGVDRLVLGTVLVKSPEEVESWVPLLGPRFAAGIDATDGSVRVAGWAEDAGRKDTEIAAVVRRLGMRWLIYTNIRRDGTLEGPDIPRTNAAARAAALPTILSGGIGSEADVQRVAELGDPLVAGVILGKALYEKKVDLETLVSRYPQGAGSPWDSPGER